MLLMDLLEKKEPRTVPQHSDKLKCPYVLGGGVLTLSQRPRRLVVIVGNGMDSSTVRRDHEAAAVCEQNSTLK